MDGQNVFGCRDALTVWERPDRKMVEQPMQIHWHHSHIHTHTHTPYAFQRTAHLPAPSLLLLRSVNLLGKPLFVLEQIMESLWIWNEVELLASADAFHANTEHNAGTVCFFANSKFVAMDELQSIEFASHTSFGTNTISHYLDSRLNCFFVLPSTLRVNRYFLSAFLSWIRRKRTKKVLANWRQTQTCHQL